MAESNAGRDGDSWILSESGVQKAASPSLRSLFALGNGFLGVVGDLEEQRFPHGPDVYLNGVYEVAPIHYHERAAALPETTDTRIPVAGCVGMVVEIDGERFSPDSGEVLNHARRLDMRAGLLERAVSWRSPRGKVADISFQRIVSLDQRPLVGVRVEVVPADPESTVRILSGLSPPSDDQIAEVDSPIDPRIVQSSLMSPWEIESEFRVGGINGLLLRTRRSRIGVACAVRHQVNAGELQADGLDDTGDASIYRAECRPDPTGKVSMTKFAAYETDRGEAGQDLKSLVAASVKDAGQCGFDALVDAQRQHLEAFWDTADIVLEGDKRVQQAIRFSVYQLYQAAGRDGLTSLAAKGQTGKGYEGHYFWDAEIFTFPFFVFTAPQIARKMLEYRYHCLCQAREIARRMDHPRGALYPWRTIGGGECSAYFPAGTAQYHINADIAHAVRQYVEATGDDDFLVDQGAEIVLETARLWCEAGYHNPHRNVFCINEVTGPDEYTVLVDNNFYTNAMARAHLQYAVKTAGWMSQNYPQKWRELVAGLELEPSEVGEWQEAGEAMCLPYSKELGIYLQDDDFVDKKPWPFETTPAGKYPLLLHYHPLTIYRHQVCKQADTILALFLLDGQFDPEAARRSFDYYERITVHDSSLSTSIFSILASRIGEVQKAYDYFTASLLEDLDNRHHNTSQGLHLAAMGGSWMSIVHGFAGVRTGDGRLSFSPVLPATLEAYAFKLRFRGRTVSVRIDTDGAQYAASGDPLAIIHHGKVVELDSKPIRLPLPGRSAEDER